MGRKSKIWLIVASVLVLTGGVVFVGAMTKLNWDFTKLSTVQYETNEYEIIENYQNISITTDTADVVFVPCEDGKSTVTCYEQENVKHFVAVKNGILTIEVADSREWHDYIGVFFGTPKITVSIPKGEYGVLSVKSGTGDVEIPEQISFDGIDVLESTGDVKCFASASQWVKIKTDTGKIHVENITTKDLELSVSTGDVTVSNVNCEENVAVNVSTGRASLTDVTCESLTSTGSTGDIVLKDTVAEKMIRITRDTGDVRLVRSDAAEIFVETDTGDVEGSLLSDKIFIVDNNTGKVIVPESLTGGKCDISTSTGDVKFHIDGGN